MHLMRPHHDDPSHAIDLQEIAQLLFYNATLAARCMPQDDSDAISGDDSSVKHI
jgi:hypothetical protein